MEFPGKDGGKKGGEGRERPGLCLQLFIFSELSAQPGAPTTQPVNTHQLAQSPEARENVRLASG